MFSDPMPDRVKKDEARYLSRGLHKNLNPGGQEVIDFIFLFLSSLLYIQIPKNQENLV